MRKIILVILFTLAFLERIVYDLGPNVELVTTVMILVSFYYGKKESFWMVFFIMFFSDLIIGNTNIFIFTWTGFLIPALFSENLINKFTNLKSSITYHQSLITKKMSISSSLALTGLSSNIFFYLWTNFGVWLLSGMYSKTAMGLLMSYINALPFLRYQAVSTLLFVPLGFFLTEITISMSKKYQLKNKLVSSLNIRH